MKLTRVEFKIHVSQRHVLVKATYSLSFKKITTWNSHLYDVVSSMPEKLLHICGVRLSSLHPCKLAVGGFYNPLPLPSDCFGTALNVADPPRERANGGVVCRGRVEGVVWDWAVESSLKSAPMQTRCLRA